MAQIQRRGNNGVNWGIVIGVIGLILALLSIVTGLAADLLNVHSYCKLPSDEGAWNCLRRVYGDIFGWEVPEEEKADHPSRYNASVG